MARMFQKLTRRAVRTLKPREKITEAGITAERLADGDVRYSVDVVVSGQRPAVFGNDDRSGSDQSKLPPGVASSPRRELPSGWVSSVAINGMRGA